MKDYHDRGIVLFVSASASFIVPFMASSINVALPTIGKEFSMNAVLLGWVATAYILSCAVFTVPFGKIADIYGRRRVFTVGILLYTIFSILCGISSSASFFIFSRALQGLGSSMIFATNLAILTSVFPPQERGRVLGISVAFTYAGMSMGPFLGGILTHHFGWRSIFFTNVALGGLLLLLALKRVRGEWAEASEERFDFVGSLLYALMLVSTIYGFSLLPERRGIWFILLGCSMLLAFVLWESKVKDPILDMMLFKRNRVFAFSGLAALIHYSATFAVTFLLSLFLQYIKGLDPRTAGSILIFQPLIMSIFSPLAGKLSDKSEPRFIASLGMSITGMGIVNLCFLSLNTSLSYVIASLIILGFGFAFFSSPNTNAIMSSVERRFYGVASGMVATMRMIGQMLSMGIVMLVFSLKLGRVQITPDRYDSFMFSVRTSFTIFAVLCFFGVLASLTRGKLREGFARKVDSGEK